MGNFDKIDHNKFDDKKIAELHKIQDEMREIQAHDFQEKIDDPEALDELRDEVLSEAKAIAGHQVSPDELLTMDPKSIVGQNDDQKHELLRLQKQMQQVQNKDLEEMKDDPTKRLSKEEELLDRACKIMNKNVTIPQFMGTNIDNLKITKQKKQELKHIQDRLRKLVRQDWEDKESNFDERHELEEQILENAQNLMGKDFDNMEDFVNADLDKLDLDPAAKRRLETLQKEEQH